MEFSYQELAKATNNFSLDNKIGQGGFGAVYYAELRGKVVTMCLFSSITKCMFGYTVENHGEAIFAIGQTQKLKEVVSAHRHFGSPRFSIVYPNLHKISQISDRGKIKIEVEDRSFLH